MPYLTGLAIKPKESDTLHEQSQTEIARLQAVIEQLKKDQTTERELRKNQISILRSKDEKELTQAKERIRELENALLQEKPDIDKQNQELKERVKLLRASKIKLTEAQTRFIIDEQLRNAGWEADSINLDYQKGTRPEKGRNMAIAEWEMQGKKHRADYVLFIGLMPVATVEAKRKHINVASAISQAQRYSQSFDFPFDLIKPRQVLSNSDSTPWLGAEGEKPYQLPFVFSCNGKPFLQQSIENSGTWFRDCRLATNVKRACESFLSPAGLMDLLHRDKIKAEQQLLNEPFDYLGLRPYQQKAVMAVEDELAQNARQALLAMATGTGKTRTIIGLLYRFLKTERFKRILFLVDRTSLGDQATEAFDETRLEQNKTLSQIYDVKEMLEKLPEAETRVHVATVQAIVKRLFDNKDDKALPIDQYDCIIVDEAHRGYTL